jgi:hypothetical protein
LAVMRRLSLETNLLGTPSDTADNRSSVVGTAWATGALDLGLGRQARMS